MKRFIAAILCVGLIAAISTGCAYKDALSKDNTATTRATEATGNVATVDEIDAKNFSDNLQGLSEYFAKKEYITTKDGKIDVTDLSVLSLTLADKKELSPQAKINADVTGDSNVNLADLATLRQFLSKIITAFP